MLMPTTVFYSHLCLKKLKIRVNYLVVIILAKESFWRSLYSLS